MSTISVCVVTNTWTEYDSEKEKTLKQYSIPFKSENNKIYFIDSKDVYFSTSDVKGQEFLLDLLSSNEQYTLNGDTSQITDEIIKILINVFGEIQLDVSFTDSNSGNSGWADFRISENHEIEFIFEDDDDDDW